jgi:hypothetical protein
VADDSVSAETMTKLRAALNPAPAAVVAVPEVVAAETPEVVNAPASEETSTEQENARDEQGRFKPKELSPDAKGLLSALKAEREKRKALESKISELSTARKEPERATPKKDVLSEMPEETRKWAESQGKDWVDALIQERLSQIEPDLAEVRQSRAQRQEQAQLVADLTEFTEDCAMEGITVDPVALMDTIAHYEKTYQISLGPTNAIKCKNALGLVASQKPVPAADPKVAAEAKAKKDAAEKARAGGVAPGSTATQVAPNTRQELQTAVRDRAKAGDLRGIADIIGARTAKHPLFGGR